eukprot:Protomagalhaensia_wolfi_Nauph_80__1906@NODE_2199_length_1172_cov_10_461606_g1719_i0_p1_GENE_NODE_2199_length_1172_cov_10_461606_g1719_i0NODE_2199_length_1172_cov_10_461606_g1719_i0_p1_ORF_typecomplete_len242_score23_34_NODE_2199_length_1172_cov_10_461606_g1719_i03611086
MALATALSRYRAELVATRHMLYEEEVENEMTSRLVRLEELDQSSILGLTGRFDVFSILTAAQKNVLSRSCIPWSRQIKVGDGADLLRPLRPVPEKAAVLSSTDNSYSPGSVSPDHGSRFSMLSMGLSPRVQWTPPPPMQVATMMGMGPDAISADNRSVSEIGRSSLLRALDLSDFLNMPITPSRFQLTEEEQLGRQHRLSIISSIDRSNASRRDSNNGNLVASSVSSAKSSGLRETPVPKK